MVVPDNRQVSVSRLLLPQRNRSRLIGDEDHKQMFQRCGSLFSDIVTEFPDIFFTEDSQEKWVKNLSDRNLLNLKRKC